MTAPTRTQTAGSPYTEYGVMHPDGRMISPDGTSGYPFRSLRMAQALARDLDDPDSSYDACDCQETPHRVMTRHVGAWITR